MSLCGKFAHLVRSGLVRRTAIEPAVQIKVESSVIFGSGAGSWAVKTEWLTNVISGSKAFVCFLP